MVYTKEALAALLNGREYGEEITKQEEADAKASELVVVFGYSDDNVELRGAIHDEISAGDRTTFKLNQHGVIEQPDEDERRVLKKFGALDSANAGGHEIIAVWGKDGYAWTYLTYLPHATFDIMEDGEKYCRGIVFDLPK